MPINDEGMEGTVEVVDAGSTAFEWLQVVEEEIAGEKNAMIRCSKIEHSSTRVMACFENLERKRIVNRIDIIKSERISIRSQVSLERGLILLEIGD